MTRGTTLAMACLAAALAVGVPPSASAQEVLYSTLVRSRGYVVGAALSQSGLHVRTADGTWDHVGWNHPQMFGIAVDPRDPNTIFVAAGNGALRSLDGGETWRTTTDWRVTEVLDVAIDAHRSSDVYIATSYGVWYTHDRGDSWVRADTIVGGQYTSAVRVDRSNAGVVIVGAGDGIYRSSDRGASWSRVGTVTSITDIQQSPVDPRVWLAASHDGGLALSTDGARTWRRPSGDVAGASLYAVAIDPANGSRMAAIGFDTGVMISTDGGESWVRTTGNLPGCEALTVVTDPPENPPPCLYEVIFDKERPGRLIVATVESGVYASDDLGRRWTHLGMDGAVVYDMTFARAPR